MPIREDDELSMTLKSTRPVPGLVISEELMRLEQKRRKEVGDQFQAMDTRMSSVENRLGNVEKGLSDVVTIATEARNLSAQAVAQNAELLAKFNALHTEVEETRTETADGVAVIKKVTIVGEAARMLRLDKALMKLWPGFLALSIGWVLMRMFGPEVGTKILHRVFGW
jgi:hypothetical protein